MLALPLTEGADTITLPGLSSPSLPASSPQPTEEGDEEEIYEEYEKVTPVACRSLILVFIILISAIIEML